MYPHRLTRIAALTVVAAALAVPTASANVPAPDQVQSSPKQDLRNADNRIPATPAGRRRLRSRHVQRA